MGCKAAAHMHTGLSVNSSAHPSRQDRLKDVVFKLQGRGMKAAALHGEMSKLGRASVLNEFRRGKSRVLVVSCAIVSYCLPVWEHICDGRPAALHWHIKVHSSVRSSLRTLHAPCTCSQTPFGIFARLAPTHCSFCLGLQMAHFKGECKEEAAQMCSV